MDTSVLMVKQEIDGKGIFYKAVLHRNGEMMLCILRPQLQRGEVLRRLSRLKSLSDVYLLDQKAVMLGL
ncbi:hypothetical protein BSNK01_01860 [Bacillaceae bacterium]